mmetsp:Transcript_16499/g.41263  ORF Transcript_16499/g.41263 Transcript_16499/m.41263 type:complete len:300 (-) Transcript_16499:203-1102(-)
MTLRIAVYLFVSIPFEAFATYITNGEALVPDSCSTSSSSELPSLPAVEVNSSSLVDHALATQPATVVQPTATFDAKICVPCEAAGPSALVEEAVGGSCETDNYLFVKRQPDDGLAFRFRASGFSICPHLTHQDTWDRYNTGDWYLPTFGDLNIGDSLENLTDDVRKKVYEVCADVAYRCSNPGEGDKICVPCVSADGDAVMAPVPNEWDEYCMIDGEVSVDYLRLDRNRHGVVEQLDMGNAQSHEVDDRKVFEKFRESEGYFDSFSTLTVGESLSDEMKIKSYKVCDAAKSTWRRRRCR